MIEEIHKERAERILGHVPEDKKFFCQDGSYISTLEELSNSLKKMKMDTYKKHVTHEKNDFANWIYDVVGDSELAEKLRKSKSRKEIRELLRNRIEYLKIRTQSNK